MKKRSTASEKKVTIILTLLGLLFLIANADATSCTPGETETCSFPLPGVCGTGEKICDENGEWGNCLYPLPSPESANCNDNLDNDCDGATDFFDSDCQGSCTDGVHNQDETCIDVGGICGAYWFTELSVRCNDGLDNDCDGLIDALDDDCEIEENLSCTPDTIEACSTELLGICSTGTKTCGANNLWSSCLQDAQATIEWCNDNLDNDCDGELDEADCSNHNPEETTSPSTPTTTQTECSPKNSESCITNNPGICSTGTKTCNEEGLWGNCIQDMNSETETCNDGLDNDCDGELDEADCETEELIVTSPIDCEITSARWSQDTFGQDYILRIESKGDCDDAEIEIKIYETDVIVNDPIRTQFSTFNNGNGDLLISLSKEEVATVASGFLEGNQFEVVFKAVVRYTNQKWTKSDVLQI